MKNRPIFSEQLFVTVLVVLLLLVANPIMVWMPSYLAMLILILITSLMFLWVGFVLSEKTTDERDEIHRTHAGRAAYIAAAAMLTIALVYQGFTHTLDVWIPATLGVIIITKFVTRRYDDVHN